MLTFEEIYHENHKSIFRIAKKMVSNHDVVSDIVQEVFIDLFHKLNNKGEIRNPKSWLYRVTLNKCIDNVKRLNRFQGIETISDYKTDQETIEEKELKDAIRAAISKLKNKERMLAVLYSEGLSYREISEITGIKYASLGKMISRTLEKLKLEFKNQGYELY